MLNAYDVITDASCDEVHQAFVQSMVERTSFLTKWFSSAERKRGTWRPLDANELRSLERSMNIGELTAGGALGDSFHLVLKVFDDEGRRNGRHIILIDGALPSGLNPLADRLAAHAKKTAKVLEGLGHRADVKRRVRI